tara:strand:+ start:241 stop:453 length:213 start_codon:yes stop_codon:yes gene_type:complete
MGRVKIIVKENGEIDIEAIQGFEGKSCQEVIDFLVSRMPSGFAFDTLETVRHGNFAQEVPVPKQKYVQEN